MADVSSFTKSPMFLAAPAPAEDEKDERTERPENPENPEKEKEDGGSSATGSVV